MRAGASAGAGQGEKLHLTHIIIFAQRYVSVALHHGCIARTTTKLSLITRTSKNF